MSTLYRHHRKASPANKLVSLYLIDAIAREARSRLKKADKEGKGAGTAARSTTPADSPPGAAAGPSAGDGDFASFLRKLEAVLSKIVLDNWENGLPEHRVRHDQTITRRGGAVGLTISTRRQEKVRKVLDIWTRASTFGASALAKISSKLLAVSAAAPATAAPQMSPGRPSLSPGETRPDPMNVLLLSPLVLFCVRSLECWTTLVPVGEWVLGAASQLLRPGHDGASSMRSTTCSSRSPSRSSSAMQAVYVQTLVIPGSFRKKKRNEQSLKRCLSLPLPRLVHPLRLRDPTHPFSHRNNALPRPDAPPCLCPPHPKRPPFEIPPPHIGRRAGPAANTPPRDSTTTAPAPTAPAGIPANVLALLQAKAPPSQAALEQKKHDDVESEVERALREAREGTSLA